MSALSPSRAHLPATARSVISQRCPTSKGLTFFCRASTFAIIPSSTLTASEPFFLDSSRAPPFSAIKSRSICFCVALKCRLVVSLGAYANRYELFAVNKRVTDSKKWLFKNIETLWKLGGARSSGALNDCTSHGRLSVSDPATTTSLGVSQNARKGVSINQ